MEVKKIKMVSGGHNKGIDSRIKHICNYCNNEYLNYKSHKSKYCNRKCFFKSIIGHKYNVGRVQSDEEKEKRRNISLRRKERLGYINSSETREKLRISTINYIIKKRGKLATNIGKYEKQILDELELFLGKKITRQYPVCGYFVDGYCSELNMCIEIDEEYHKKQISKDAERQNRIMNELNCTFIRIPCAEL